MSELGFDPEILQDFLTESGELLEQLEGDLVELERRPDDGELINQVFRALHTIKGSASFLALTNLVEIAHAAETALNAARAGEATVDSVFMDLLLRAVDVLRSQFEALTSGSTDLPKADADLVEGLTAIGEGREAGPDEDAGPKDAAQQEAELSFSSGRAELLDDFLTDLDQQLDSVQTLLERLGAEENRAETVERLSELGRDLTATSSFFGLAPMTALVETLTQATAAAGELEQDTLSQLLPRLQAIVELLGEQRSGLDEGKLVEPEAETLLVRVAKLIRGEPLDPEGELAPGAGASEALEADGANRKSETSAVPAQADPEADTSTNADTPTQRQPEGEPAAKREGGKSGETIRVEVDRLEALMNLVGELVLQKNRVIELSGRANATSGVNASLAEQYGLTSEALSRVTSDIQIAVMRTRMQPLDKLFGRYPRLIRDLAQRTGKKIDLSVQGGDTEVDKTVIEVLGDPLVHLMRNAADHGLESPEERSEAGKSETGLISLSARHEGDHVRIVVADNGRGLCRERIAAKAVQRGLVSEADAKQLSDQDVHRFVFLPGFSTAEAANDLSGRGVGMDVVRNNIEKVKGSIDVSSTQGVGTQVSITIPLTVAILPAMMVEVRGEIFAAPLSNIVEIVKPSSEEVSTILETRVIRNRGGVLPLLRGEDVFGTASAENGGPPLVLVLASGERRVGLTVSRVIGQQEIVVKPLDGVDSARAVSGATVRNDGGVSLIVDVAELVRRAS